jgi:hypothetical protein
MYYLGERHLLAMKRKEHNEVTSVSTFFGRVMDFSKDRWHADFGIEKEYMVETGGYYYNIYIPVAKCRGLFVTPYVSALIERDYLRRINSQHAEAVDVIDNAFIKKLPAAIKQAALAELELVCFSHTKSKDVYIYAKSGAAAADAIAADCSSDGRQALAALVSKHRQKLFRYFKMQGNFVRVRVSKDEKGYVVNHLRRNWTNAVAMRIYYNYNDVFEKALKEHGQH